MEDIFEKALRLLYERTLERLGVQADIIITKIDPEEPRATPQPAEVAADQNSRRNTA